MKRILAEIICIGCFFALLGCSVPIREYKGTPLKSLSYQTVDYMGGYTVEYLFDFEGNAVKKRAYLPMDYRDNPPEYDTVHAFSEEQERVLINKLYSYGLFDIKKNYKSPPGISDGGGWTLAVVYNDGTEKRSQGSNNSPEKVFTNCAKAFYDICQTGIVASVPTEYYCPPNVSYAFQAGNASFGYTTYGKRLEYLWNGFEEKNQSAYEANESTDFLQSFHADTSYTLVLYTANYRTDSYPKFHACTVTSYGYNEALTNAVTEYSGGWFSRIEVHLQLNKIYVVRLSFKNGDYVAYTFNTKTAESSIA